MKNIKLTLLSVIFLTMFSLNAQEKVTNNRPSLPRVTITLPNGKAADIPKGPYKATWKSIEQNYKIPEWFVDGKFGIFIHYGVYTVAAHASEWYPRHMYSNSGVKKWQKNISVE